MKGLVIKDPWISLILEGKKIWEIRGSTAKFRGRIALIKSTTGKVFGTVEIVDSISLSSEQYYEAFNNHCIPNTRENPLPYKEEKLHAWVFANPVILKEPIPYTHPQGAVIWINLDEKFDSLCKIGGEL